MNLLTKKTLILNVLSLAALLQTIPAEASGKYDLIGGTIKNKKTHEHLALTCAVRDADEICTHYQFVIGEPKKEGGLEIRSLVGGRFTYEYARSRMLNSQISQQYKNNEYIDFTPLTSQIAGGFTGASIAMWQNIDWKWDDFSVAGKIWRVVLASAATPVLVAADLTMYAGAGAVDGVRYAAEGTADAVTEASGNLKAAKARRKTLKGMKVISSPEKEGKVVRVSSDLFESILYSIKGQI